MEEPVQNDLGCISETEACKAILRGEFILPLTTIAFTREFLRQLHQTQTRNSPPPKAE
jgi:hypothetical protein